jgi:hypothetical protein
MAIQTTQKHFIEIRLDGSKIEVNRMYFILIDSLENKGYTLLKESGLYRNRNKVETYRKYLKFSKIPLPY